jgi:hypothetical protein
MAGMGSILMEPIMLPMKDNEADTCNNAIENIFNRLVDPESIYCDEGSEFTNKKFLQLLENKNIKIIYAINHATFVEYFTRSMKRMMDKYMEFNELTAWTNIYRDLLDAYINTKHITMLFAHNDIKRKIMTQLERIYMRETGERNMNQLTLVTDRDSVRPN